MITRLIAKLPAGSYFVRRGDTAVAVTCPRRSASGRALDGGPGRLLRVRVPRGSYSLNLLHMCDLKFRLPSLDIQVIRDRLELRSTSGGLIRTIL